MTRAARIPAPSGIFALYVDNAGSDATGDGTLGNPFATPEAAVLWSNTFLDFDGRALPSLRSVLNVVLAAGQTFAAGHSSGHGQCGAQGGAAINILGQWDGAKWSKISGVGQGRAAWQQDFSPITLRNVVLEGDAGQNCLEAVNGGKVFLDGVFFGQAGVAHINVKHGGSLVSLLSGYTIVGPAPYHLVMQGGFYDSGSSTPIYPLNFLSSTGAAAFADVTDCATADMRGLALNLGGYSVSGQQYSVSDNGVLWRPAGGLPGTGFYLGTGGVVH